MCVGYVVRAAAAQPRTTGLQSGKFIAVRRWRYPVLAAEQLDKGSVDHIVDPVRPDHPRCCVQWLPLSNR